MGELTPEQEEKILIKTRRKIFAGNKLRKQQSVEGKKRFEEASKQKAF